MPLMAVPGSLRWELSALDTCMSWNAEWPVDSRAKPERIRVCKPKATDLTSDVCNDAANTGICAGLRFNVGGRHKY